MVTLPSLLKIADASSSGMPVTGVCDSHGTVKTLGNVSSQFVSKNHAQINKHVRPISPDRGPMITGSAWIDRRVAVPPPNRKNPPGKT